LGQCCSNW